MATPKYSIALLSAGALLSAMVSCSDSQTKTDAGSSPDALKVQGTEGGPCYPNGTCNSGLVCNSNICVRLQDSAVPDGPRPDAAPPDGPSPDVAKADAAPPDAGAPDAQGADATPLDASSDKNLSEAAITDAEGGAADSKPDVQPCQSPADCDDGLTCTTDICGVGGCTHLIAASYCVIDGACVAGGTKNPQNVCKWCDSFVDNKAWSNVGGICDDGNLCTHNDMCSNGACTGTSYSCDDGLACTTDECTGIQNGCLHSVQAGKCAIDGKCYNSGDVNLTVPCEKCDPTANDKGWTFTVSPTCSVTGAKCTTFGGSCGPGLACQMACGPGVPCPPAGYCSEVCSTSNPCKPPQGMNAICGSTGTCAYICESPPNTWACPMGTACNVTGGGLKVCGP